METANRLYNYAWHCLADFYHHYCEYPLCYLGIVDPPMTYEEVKTFLERDAKKKLGAEPLWEGRKVSEIFNQGAKQQGKKDDEPYWEFYQRDMKHRELMNDPQTGFITSFITEIGNQIPDDLKKMISPSFGAPDPTLLNLADRLKPGTFLDLGCGYQGNTVKMLEKGWTVIALDSCQMVLDDLKEALEKLHPDWVAKGQITFVCKKMEAYTFPKNIQLIFAQSLPYCPPQHVLSVWDKIYDSLEEEGHLVGHIYPRNASEPTNLAQEWCMGAWLGPRTLGKALLQGKGYEILSCDYDTSWFKWWEPKRVWYSAQKPKLPFP